MCRSVFNEASVWPELQFQAKNISSKGKGSIPVETINLKKNTFLTQLKL